MFAKVLLLLSMLLLALATSDEKSSIEKLDPELFGATLQHHFAFVMFFVPWCGHCQLLQPLWEQLAGMMSMVNEPRLVIAQVNCVKHEALCNRHKIVGYPTLRFFKIGEEHSVTFRGKRSLPTMVDFVNQQLHGNGEVARSSKERNFTNNERPGLVSELTDDTFHRHIARGYHYVKFFVPWCGHCRRLAPTWQSLAIELRDEPAVTLSKLDCMQFYAICEDFDVESYPTLLWIENGKKIEWYRGARNVDALKLYVKKMLFASRWQTAAADGISSGGAKTKVLQLLANSFDKSVAQGVTFVNFYVPWCRHCQQLSATWHDLAEKVYSIDSDTIIATVDCTAPENARLCKEQQVDGYPSLFAYKNGIRQREYFGSRTLDELHRYIKSFGGHEEF